MPFAQSLLVVPGDTLYSKIQRMGYRKSTDPWGATEWQRHGGGGGCVNGIRSTWHTTNFLASSVYSQDIKNSCGTGKGVNFVDLLFMVLEPHCDGS